MADRSESLNERLLVLRCQTGDEDAYRELISRFGPRLTYFLRKLIANADHATVFLLVRSRSATLRQINANLLDISEQLKRAHPLTQHRRHGNLDRIQFLHNLNVLRICDSDAEK